MLHCAFKGNWGCGAFGGDPEYKAMIQWMAASMGQSTVSARPLKSSLLRRPTDKLNLIHLPGCCPPPPPHTNPPLASRDVVYFTFSDTALADRLRNCVDLIHTNRKIDGVWFQ